MSKKGLFGFGVLPLIKRSPERDDWQKEAFLELLEKFEEIEKGLKYLPEVRVADSDYGWSLIAPVICMGKELSKLLAYNYLYAIPNNPHVMEEIELLQKIMRNLEEDLRVEKLRKF